ncbi:MAG TPA: hypothetical protein VN739_06970 [Nitrososphaerales archaeon]|nr:hypothetical protein [Nitrososphaerales archaeon]
MNRCCSQKEAYVRSIRCYPSETRGYQYYAAVIYPYERQDGQLWLFMGMSEGILQLDSGSSFEESTVKQEGPVPTIVVARKPKVSISK